jgi:hypothetical protein
MAVQPIQYLAPPQDPFTQALKGVQTVAALSKMKAQRDATEAAEVAANQAAERKAQYRFDVETAFTDGSPRAFAKLSATYPEQASAFKQSLSMLNEDQQKNEIAVTGQVYTALQNNNPEVAKKILDEQITASENAGRNIESLKMFRDNMEKDPKTAKGFAGMMLSSVMGPEKFMATYKGIGEEERAKELHPGVLKKQAADLGMTEAQTNKVIAETKNLGLAEKKIALELESMKTGKTLDINKKFDQEDKLRDEYAAKTKNYSEARTTFENIKSSAADNSGAGDLALVFSFMKMLDPGSVVRESEFALAQDTAGMYERLQNQAQKIQDGQFLTPPQRQSFARLAEKYMGSTSSHEKRVKESYGAIIENYGLNPEHVFGGKKKEETTEAATVAPTKTTPTAIKVEPVTAETLSARSYMKY